MGEALDDKYELPRNKFIYPSAGDRMSSLMNEGYTDAMILNQTGPIVNQLYANAVVADQLLVTLRAAAVDIRNVLRLPLPMNQGIGATLTSCGLNINHEKWQYNITHSNQTEFLMYEVDGKYEAHVDTFHQLGNETRKLTCLAILNDDFEGGKFYIMNSNEKIYPPQEKGDIIVFPSFIDHTITPITKGKRYSLVLWNLGDPFK